MLDVHLLLDAHLSFRLTKKLSLSFSKVTHVSETGLSVPAKDREIWNWAKKEGCVIVTQDIDFFNLLLSEQGKRIYTLFRLRSVSCKGR